MSQTARGNAWHVTVARYLCSIGPVWELNPKLLNLEESFTK